MSLISPDLAPALPDAAAHTRAVDEFVLLWSEMASAWGINRTMAQIHALLYVSEESLDTDTIMARLDISRGNANINLRALLEWGLAWKTSRPGSRKDYFVAETDVWRITTTIIEERQRREIQPVQRALVQLSTSLREDGHAPGDAMLTARVDALVGLIEVFDGFSSALLPLLRGRNAETVQKVVVFASKLRSGRPDAPDAR